MIYPRLYAFLLPFRGMRVPARMSVVAGHQPAVLAGFGVRSSSPAFRAGAHGPSSLRRSWKRAVDFWVLPL